MKLYKSLLRLFPSTKLNISIARIHIPPEQFIKKTFFNSLFTAVFVCIIIYFFTVNLWFFILIPVLWILFFLYLLQYPKIRAYKLSREINKEIVFAGRFMIIELESGLTLYNAISNLAKNYENIGVFFKEIIEKVDLGSSLEDALNESVNLSPSRYMKRVLWQILNSIKTGSDISSALRTVISQIVKEQEIEITEYGRRLNPLAMFYLILTIIMPSLGTLMFIVLNTIIGMQITLALLLTIAFVVGFIQFIFVAIMKQGRPAIDI